MADPRIETLIASFYHDPLVEFFWPNEGSRANQLSVGLEFLLGLSSTTRSLEIANNRCAAVIGATSPEDYPPPFFSSMVELSKLILKSLRFSPFREMKRWIRVYHQLEKIHPRQPHWYVLVLGAHPDHQGKGLGGELLKPILQKADEESVGVYLECSNPKSLDFYNKHGFRVIEEIVPIHGCPPIWRLIRKPISESS
jgi:ribosomal protein S18 acetylase RimI-like enzyme